MRHLVPVIAALALMTGVVSLVDTFFLRVTPTDHVLALAQTLAQTGKLFRLEKIADSAPDSPLGKMMKAGLQASQAGESQQALDLAMVAAAERAVRWSRGLLGLGCGLSVACWAALAFFARARSAVAFVVSVLASLACGLAVASEQRVEAELRRARAELAPLLFTAESTSTGR